MGAPISLRAQSMWLFFAKIISFILALALPLLVVRHLSQHDIGTYRQVFLVIANASTILPLGLPMTALYFLPREPQYRSQIIFNIMLFNFLVGAAFFLLLFLFPQIPAKIFANSEIQKLAILIGITVWLWIFSSFLEVIAIANQEARLATVFIVFSQLSKTSMMTAAVLLFSTVQSLLYAAILQSILQILILLVYLTRRFGNFWFAFDFNFFLKHMRYAFPIGFAGLIWILQGDLHNYFVSYRFGAEQFAIYAYGCFQIPLIAILREAVASVLIPKMSELEVKGDKAEMIRLTFRAIQKLSFFYFPLYVFLFLTADTFIKTLFTERFEASIPIFLVNLTLLPFEILILDPIVRAYRDLGDFLLKVRIIMLAVLIVFLYLAILYLNLTGVIAIVVSMIICEKLIFSLIAAHKLGITSRDLKSLLDVFKIAMISVIAGIVLMPFYFIAKDFTMSKFIAYFNSQFLAGTLFLALCMAIFSAVYLILSYYSGVIENEEKARLRELLRF